MSPHVLYSISSIQTFSLQPSLLRVLLRNIDTTQKVETSLTGFSHFSFYGCSFDSLGTPYVLSISCNPAGLVRTVETHFCASWSQTRAHTSLLSWPYRLTSKKKGTVKELNRRSIRKTGKDQSPTDDKPLRYTLTRLMRMKICLCNLPNQITFHLPRSGGMLVLCVMAQGSERLVIVMIKNTVISDLCRGFSSGR